MRTSQRSNYAETSRQSIQKDFQKQRTFPEYKKKKEGQRIIKINHNCMYAKEARFFVGKLVKLIEDKGEGNTSGWYSFVFDSDRRAINEAMGWTAKDRYLLTKPVFK